MLWARVDLPSTARYPIVRSPTGGYGPVALEESDSPISGGGVAKW